MLLHDVRYETFEIRNDDTLENPAFLGNTFDAVVRTHHTVRNGQQIQNLKMMNDSSGYGKRAKIKSRLCLYSTWYIT